MTVSAIGSNNPLTSALLAKGLSSDKIKLVEQDLEASVTAATPASGAKPDNASVRATLDKRIAADVASGKLSKEDAAAISKVLDEADQASANTDKASGSTAPAGGPPKGGGGGGGAGGSSEKTELSRTVLITGNIKTTTITYTDGTTETTTGPANGEKSTKDNAATTSSDSVASNYLAQIEPGSLIDKLA
jgi:hypothetical protein